MKVKLIDCFSTTQRYIIGAVLGMVGGLVGTVLVTLVMGPTSDLVSLTVAFVSGGLFTWAATEITAKR